MAKKTLGNLVGSYAFLIGVILAVVAGLFYNTAFISTHNDAIITTLLVVGLIVGLLNISSKESSKFLMSGTVLVIASFFGLGLVGSIVPMAGQMLAYMIAIFVPATIIVAIKNVFTLAKD